MTIYLGILEIGAYVVTDNGFVWCHVFEEAVHGFLELGFVVWDSSFEM